MLRKIRDVLTRPRRFRRSLAKATPLIDGRETRKVAAALGYRADVAEQMIAELPFDPRETYPERALEWARGQ